MDSQTHKLMKNSEKWKIVKINNTLKHPTSMQMQTKSITKIIRVLRKKLMKSF